MEISFWHSLKRKVSFLFCFVIILVVFSSTAQETQVKTVENFCPYFENRAPLPQPDLQNCTWYRSKSCCLSKELSIIFDNIPPPTGANKKCLGLLNRLMCFVCAPNQNLFYRDERLTVCIEFCDNIYEACGDATLKGSQIKDTYNTGTEFCLSRKFIVASEMSEKCFMPADLDVESSAGLVPVQGLLIGLMSLLTALVR